MTAGGLLYVGFPPSAGRGLRLQDDTIKTAGGLSG